ncbi:hypothetical protein PIB30_066407 [Stylosanthes scabra]|uniref:Uncharacterized protein n=1 Tax=Stylosanthes scabra TaxID=79078 RepID=A0ABU6ZL56_9FABA|nr:hypothetical protein [Stylosanthes scabra]
MLPSDGNGASKGSTVQWHVTAGHATSANLRPGLAMTAATGMASPCVLPSGSSSSFSLSRHSTSLLHLCFHRWRAPSSSSSAIPLSSSPLFSSLSLTSFPSLSPSYGACPFFSLPLPTTV